MVSVSSILIPPDPDRPRVPIRIWIADETAPCQEWDGGLYAEMISRDEGDLSFPPLVDFDGPFMRQPTKAQLMGRR